MADNLHLLSYEERAQAIMEKQGVPDRAARMATDKGLTGDAARQYAEGIQRAARQRLVTEMNAAAERGSRDALVRCQQIMGHPAAAGCPDLATHLALETNLTASQAIQQLEEESLARRIAAGDF